MARLFGTDGVRGIANVELTVSLAMKIGKASAYVLTKNRKNIKVIIGNDGRQSADMLVSSFMAGLCSAGVDVVNVGMVPTPAISYLIQKYQLDAGVMITASHNPYEFNGIKIFDSNGYKLPDELEDEIEQYVREDFPYPNDKIGRIFYEEDAGRCYADYLLECVRDFNERKNVDFHNFRIAIDCSNGAASEIVEYLFSQLGCQYHIIHHRPNGKNINDHCGSLYPEELSKYVVSHQMDVGVAFDGDADRAIFVDELGNIVDGDSILAVFGMNLLERGKLSCQTIVGTVMSNLGLVRFCKERDISFLATKVGDKYVLEEMNLGNYSLGGEQSGHIILKDYANTGDGELTAIVLLSILSQSGKKFSELVSVMKKYPQVLLNAKVCNEKKNDFYMNERIKNAIEEVSFKLSGRGRILVRPSGTESLVRVMIEAEEMEEIRKYAEELVNIIEEELK